MTRKPIPKEINKFIRENKGIYSNRKMSREILKKFNQKVSYEYVRKYLSDDNIKVVKPKVVIQKVSKSKAESDIEKTNGYLEFLDSQEKYPVTITEFLNLLEKNKDHIYYRYFIKRLTKGSKSSRSEFMKFFEFIQDII